MSLLQELSNNISFAGNYKHYEYLELSGNEEAE
jgi:hypothetical protein